MAICKGWQVVSQENLSLDAFLNNAFGHAFVGKNCADPECPVHGSKKSDGAPTPAETENAEVK